MAFNQQRKKAAAAAMVTDGHNQIFMKKIDIRRRRLRHRITTCWLVARRAAQTL